MQLIMFTLLCKSLEPQGEYYFICSIGYKISKELSIKQITFSKYVITLEDIWQYIKVRLYIEK